MLTRGRQPLGRPLLARESQLSAPAPSGGGTTQKAVPPSETAQSLRRISILLLQLIGFRLRTGALMNYLGSCHCGSVTANYETNARVILRQDGCGFCSSRGVKSASDPNGCLTLVSQLKLVRYRFGHKTADFLVCPTCGTYVAALMEAARGPVGVLNVVGLAIAELKDEPATLAGLEGESVGDRIQRRLSRWTPMNLTEPAT